MARPDTKNAHVRRGSEKPQRGERSQALLDAERLMEDPAFQNAVSDMEHAIVSLIVETQHDGSPEADAAEREMCRSLRTLKRLPRLLQRKLQGEQLRLADFRPHDPEGDE